MRDWFESLQTRERNFVIAGAIVVALAVLYYAIWLPLDTRHDGLRADVDDWERSVAELKPLRALLNAAPGTSNRASGQQTPLIVVDQTLRSRGLDRYRTRSQPTTSNGLRVEFEDVAFDDLVLWLGDLSAQYSMHVQAGTFSGGSRIAEGRVNATLTLERAL